MVLSTLTQGIEGKSFDIKAIGLKYPEATASFIASQLQTLTVSGQHFLALLSQVAS